MANDSDKKYAGMRAYTADKNRKAIEKASAALDEMERNGEHITFESVAKKASIARSTLYCNPEISDRIKQVRTSSKGIFRQKPIIDNEREQGLQEKVEQLKVQLKKLQAENNGLVSQKKMLVGQLLQMENLENENASLKRRLVLKTMD